MKVVHVIENIDDSYGGPARSVPNLCHYLNQHQINNVIVSINLHGNEHNTVIEKRNIEWVNLPCTYSRDIRFSYSKALKKTLTEFAKENYIFHVHNLWTFPSYCVSRLFKRYGFPLIISARSNLYQESLQRSRLKKMVAWHLVVCR